MKKHTLLVFFFSFHFSYSQTPGEWTWMKGDSTLADTGNFGIKGVPNPANYPPSLYSVAAWTDLQGSFWIYGGLNYKYNTAGKPYGDLWKYDVSLNTWLWITGSGVPNSPAVYGTLGVPSPTNTPGRRLWGMSAWTDLNGNFWLFGGTNGGSGGLNDLWKYNMSSNEWVWMSGGKTLNSPGNYGTQGIPSSLNVPPSRYENSTAWLDNLGNLWLFGGGDGNGNAYNDLWKYNISTNEWTWVNGDSTTGITPVYGIKGVSTPGNQPGSRWSYSHWKDKAGNFWLMGGINMHGLYLNDLWKYDVNTNMWAWITGSNVPLDMGTYNNYCDTNTINYPTSRGENRACWTDECGNFYLFGGESTTGPSGGPMNDLWQYNPKTNNWKWINGTNIFWTRGTYGTMGVSGSSNVPASRFGALGGIDRNGYLWLFGGFYNDSLGIQNTLGDLWRYVPDPACGGCSMSEFTDDIHVRTTLLVYPNPVHDQLTINIGGLLGSARNDVDLNIYNVLGEKVYSHFYELPTTNYELKTNVSDLRPGIYFVEVSSGERVYRGKFVKE